MQGEEPLDILPLWARLLAFLLAFTFGLAASHYDSRRQLLLDEANAIGTTWLRASMLPEGGDEIQSLLRQYVDTRLEAMRAPERQRAGATILSFGLLGYHAGLVSTRRSPAILPVAVTFAVVIWLIADLDRPHEGTLTLNQQALIDVRRSMQGP